MNNQWHIPKDRPVRETSEIERVLRQLADSLPDSSDGLLTANVVPTKGWDHDGIPNIAGKYTLFVIAPKLDGISRRILEVEANDPMTDFPAEVSFTGEE